MKGRSVGKASQCDFNSAAIRIYKQQLIPAANLPKKGTEPSRKGSAPVVLKGRCHAKAFAVQPWEMGIDFPVL